MVLVIYSLSVNGYAFSFPLSTSSRRHKDGCGVGQESRGVSGEAPGAHQAEGGQNVVCDVDSRRSLRGSQGKKDVGVKGDEGAYAATLK